MKKEKPITLVRHCVTLKDVHNLISYCKQTRICSFDYETTGLQYYRGDMYPTILGVSFQPGSAWIIPLGHFDSPFKDNWIEILQLFGREVLMNDTILKIAYNFKFEYKWCKKVGINCEGRLFDPMLAKYLLDENTKNGLKEVTAMLAPEHAGYDDEVGFLVKKHKGWDKVPYAPLAEYCGIDCDMALRIMMYFHKRLITGGFYLLFRNLLMMATRVLGESEFYGLRVDTEYLDDLINRYRVKIDEEIHKLESHPRVKRFMIKKRKLHTQTLIDKVREDIAGILEDEDRKNKDVLIKNREQKIRNYLEGKFSAKENYDGLNFASPLQLQELLYTSPNGFCFPPQTRWDKNTKKAKMTTDEEALLKIKKIAVDGFYETGYGYRKKKIQCKVEGTDFIDNLLELRGLQKLFGTNMVGMMEVVDEHGFIHTNYKIHGTVTGRLSSAEPNMQNIPRTTTNSEIKPMFVPPKGMLHYEVDYSQAELRVVGEIAVDEVMIDIFKRGYNIHVATACQVNNCLDKYDEVRKIIKDETHPENDKWEREKKKAKTVNFGIIYGQSAQALADALGIKLKEAEDFIKGWLDSYKGVKQWMKDQIAFCRAEGYVKNIFGQKRRLPDIWHDNDGFREKAERDCINAPIQGAASHFTVLSTVVLREQRMQGKLPAYLVQRYTVHDSIGFYAKGEDIHWINPLVVKICSNPNTLEYFGFEMQHVNMKVSSELGKDWGNLFEIEDKTDIPALLIKIAS